jgi:hypothetical protein
MAVAAMVALAFAVIIPPGFMPARAADGVGLALVICTGHGPLQVGASQDHPSPTQKSKAGAACPFAAAAATAPPPTAPAVVHSFARFALLEPVVAGDQSPGRGLAAPPPPAIGPPSLV